LKIKGDGIMANENINLWFARNKDGSIVTIDKIDKENKHEDYMCPICGSNVIPKAIKDNALMSRHFAHRDASKCDSETQIHFFVKNELIKQGDKFKVKLDTETKEFVCKEVFIEQQYKTEFGTYKPDITILTEDNEIVYFEVANTNKKKIEEYLDIWIELNNIVVEVGTNELLNGNDIKEFKAKFYKDKCFNINKEERDYYDIIGRIKLSKNKYPTEQINKLSWLWKDINKYLLGELEISELSNLIQAIEDKELKEIVVSILRKNRCTGIMEDYIKYNIDIIKKNIGIHLRKIVIPRLVFDRIYGKYDIHLKLNGNYESIKCKLTDNYDYNKFIKMYECCYKIGKEYNISDNSIHLYYIDNLNIYFRCYYTHEAIKIDKFENDYIENCILSMIDNYTKYKRDLEIKADIRREKIETSFNLERKYSILLYNKINNLFKGEYDIRFIDYCIIIKKNYKNTFDIIYETDYKGYKRIKDIHKDIKNYFEIEINKLDSKYSDIDIKLINIKRNINLKYMWEIISFYNKDDCIHIEFGEKYYKTEYNKRSHRYVDVLSHKHITCINMYYDYLKYDADYVSDKINEIIINEIHEYETTNKRSNSNRPIILKYYSKLDKLKDKKFEKFDEISKYRFLNKENLYLIRDRIMFVDNRLCMIPLNFLVIENIEDRKKFIKNLIKKSSIEINGKPNKELKLYIDNILEYYDDNYDLCKISITNNILNGYFKLIIEKYNEKIYIEYLLKLYNDKIFIINKNKYLNNQEELKTEIENDIRQKIYKL
jgi:hypothetical protein